MATCNWYKCRATTRGDNYRGSSGVPMVTPSTGADQWTHSGCGGGCVEHRTYISTAGNSLWDPYFVAIWGWYVIMLLDTRGYPTQVNGCGKLCRRAGATVLSCVGMQLLTEIYKMLHVYPIKTTPYHPRTRWTGGEIQQDPQAEEVCQSGRRGLG